MDETGHSKRVLWDEPVLSPHPEGWEGGSGWGTHVHPWLAHVDVWQKPLQQWNVIILQLKLIN